MIDLYCERIAPGLWGEPFNTLSNIAFFAAAWAAWRLARRHGAFDNSVGLLLALLLAIGTGSTLFHMFATGWAEWLDVIPILLFQLAYIWLYLRRIADTPLPSLLLLQAGFLGANYAASLVPELLNGSAAYLPALAFLGGLGVYHVRSGKGEPWLLLAAAGTFIMSLLFRTIDNAACNAMSMGTHMFWHLLNSVVLYLALRAFIINVSGKMPAATAEN